MITHAKVGQYKLIFDQLHALGAGRDQLLRLRGIEGGGDVAAFEKGGSGGRSRTADPTSSIPTRYRCASSVW